MGGEEGGWGWYWAPWQEAKSGEWGGEVAPLAQFVFVFALRCSCCRRLLLLFVLVFLAVLLQLWRLSVEVVVCCCHCWLPVDCCSPLPFPPVLCLFAASFCFNLCRSHFYLVLPLLISRFHVFYLHAFVHIFTTPVFCFGCGRGRQEKEGEMGGEGGVAGRRVVQRRWSVREGSG